ncbi:hypothetical protein E2C01_026244 [Portunus trituberculatus]|uniref:Uncharacterized protein n=1 Tax=Portunus trituberculatus TaxID=210409 RepID=A0A5B7EEY0_PORTR|nr:hypothetical protein [Portunus trituberculatus]
MTGFPRSRFRGAECEEINTSFIMEATLGLPWRDKSPVSFTHKHLHINSSGGLITSTTLEFAI